MKKRVAVCTLVMFLMLAFLPAVSQAEWKTTSNGKKMYTANNAKGYLTGWQTIDGARYYFNAKGIMKTGWVTISKKTYYFGSDGKMRTGWQKIGDHTYYFGTDGAKRKGWTDVTVEKSTYRYYFLPKNGRMVTGLTTINGQKYYFGSNGKLQYGFIRVGGKVYYGKPKTGMLAKGEWIDLSSGGKSKMYYFNASCIMETNKWIDGRWVDSDGSYTGVIKNYGFVTVSGGKVVYYSGGVIQKGFITVSGKKYYMNPSTGYRTTGAFTVGNYKYYADKDGVLYVNKWKGKKYYLSSGAMATGWQTIGGKRYYFKADGNRVSGWQTISGKQYYFKTGVLQINAWVKSGKKYYHVGADGAKQFGLIKVGNYYYFLSTKSDGRRLTGWITSGGKRYRATNKAYLYCNTWFNRGKYRYYAKGDCALATGLNVIAGKTYYFDTAKGIMQKNTMKTVGSDTYYFGSDGAAIAKKWQQVSGKYYYFGADGKMVKNTIVDGYRVNADGSRGSAVNAKEKTGWNTVNGKAVYLVNGQIATGWHTISGKKYYLDGNGQKTTGMQVIGGKKYYFLYTGALAAGYGTLTTAGNAGGVIRIYTVNNEGVITAEQTVTGSGKGYAMALEAVKYIGGKYVYGGNSLESGLDCSAFVQQMHRKAGYTIGRSTYQQIELMGGGNGYTKGTAIKCNASTLKPGDLIYYNSNSHVAMYIGKGMIVHASNSKAYPDGGIKVSNYLYGNVYKAVRFWS